MLVLDCSSLLDVVVNSTLGIIFNTIYMLPDPTLQYSQVVSSFVIMSDGTRRYNFDDDPGAILAKYADQPPSLELHVYSTHYRFANQEGIIPRNNPSIQAFLKSVEEGVILPAATEVFRDSGTRFYEGCIILNLVDYTHQSSTDDSKTPESYRILLRPTDLSLWHDLLYTTDASQGRFGDQLALSMESEILNLTVRNLDLRVPDAQVQDAFNLDAKLAHKDPAIYKNYHRVTKPLPARKLHEDAPVQMGSALEDFMLLLSEEGQSSTVPNQFMRLGFIEQLKKKQQLQQQLPHAPPQPPHAPQGPGTPHGRMAMPQTMPGAPNNGPPGVSGQAQARFSPQARPQPTAAQQQQMLRARQNQMARQNQLQRARMQNAGMTPAHAQVQQQAHAHAMRNATGPNGMNGVGANMGGMGGQIPRQLSPAEQQLLQQQQQSGQPAPQVPMNMMNYNVNMPMSHQSRVMQQNQTIPYSPDMH